MPRGQRFWARRLPGRRAAVAGGEMRLRAPDAVLCGPGQRFSLHAPEGAVTLAIRARFQGPIVMEDTDPARPAMSD